jgi:HPt (histidine-containing phosphotransfer) domain-containing protein
MKFDPRELKSIIDLTEFEENYGDMTEELPRLIDNFLLNCPKRFECLANAIAAKDSESIRASAHSLKGMLSQIFAVNSREHAIQLELAGKEARLDGVVAVKSKLEAELKRLYEFLSERKSQILASQRQRA